MFVMFVMAKIKHDSTRIKCQFVQSARSNARGEHECEHERGGRGPTALKWDTGGKITHGEARSTAKTDQLVHGGKVEEAAGVGRVIFSARLHDVLTRLQQQRLRLIHLPLREHRLGYVHLHTRHPRVCRPQPLAHLLHLTPRAFAACRAT